MKHPLTAAGLAGNAFVLLFMLALCLMHGTPFDIMSWSQRSEVIDIAIALPPILGAVAGPVLIAVAFFRRPGLKIIPFAASVGIFGAACLLFAVRFDAFTPRIFLLPALHAVVYGVLILIKSIFIRGKQRRATGAGGDGETGFGNNSRPRNIDRLKPKERFAGVVDDYVKYRPGYPRELIAILEREYGLSASSAVADIGSGTGKLTALFLDHGALVYAVEPNAAMRLAAERLFAGRTNFISRDGSAEDTGLPDRSVELIVAGTAFHWFNPLKTKIEFTRVLKPGGTIALVWNKRDRDSGFMREYDDVIQTRCPEYKNVGFNLFPEEAITGFFKPLPVKLHSIKNRQAFDRDGLLGRVKSTSYCPKEGSDDYRALARDLKSLFDRQQQGNRIVFTYDTIMYAGKMTE